MCQTVTHIITLIYIMNNPSEKKSRTDYRPGGKIKTSKPKIDRAKKSYVSSKRKPLLKSIHSKSIKPEIDYTNFDLSSESILTIVKMVELDLEKIQISQLTDYLFLLKDLNQEINLISRTSFLPSFFQSLHESLKFVADSDWRRGTTLLDVGSGGGFPGLVLAITVPDLVLTLMDSRRSKTLALYTMAKTLELKNVSVVHDRAETYTKRTNHAFDMATFRAVGPLGLVAQWSESLLTPGGRMFVWKGSEGYREMREVDLSKWKYLRKIPIVQHRGVMIFELAPRP